MAPRRKFDKKNATTFSIVHRAHDDANFFDEEATEHVLVPVTTKPQPKKKIYTPEELKLDGEVRDNEGLAAQYGIFYDDSKYDYMQHLKPMGQQDSVFIGVESKDSKDSKGKNKIEDLFQGQLPSEQKRRIGPDLDESIPRELQGFNPNLDPRLREVLQALEDEAYIAEEAEEQADGDIFNDLLKSGEVEDEDEFYYGSDAEAYDEEYDEWDLDNYEQEYNEKYESGEPREYNHEELTDEVPEIHQNWQGVMQFKKENKNKLNDWDSDDEFEDDDEEEKEEYDAVGDLPEINNKKKSNTKLRKKKGAMTDTSSFSMSSSALFRTEGLTLLDDRYEQLNKKFSDEVPEQEEYSPFNMAEERNDFESMLDDFLDNYELESGGRKLAKKNEEKKKLQNAADSVSRGKVAKSRMKDLSSSLNNMKI